tara:strand:+ start:1814 stop:2377 length:564 start_codon:yes stop_codon:yes gene_type:complete
MALFWSDVKTEPKRRYRFTLGFSNKGLQNEIPLWTVKTAAKPKATVSTIEHQFMDHIFKYPGRVTWDPITVTLVDPVDPDLSWQFLNVLGKGGYKYPTTSEVSEKSLSKKAIHDAMGDVFIKQIDDLGTPIETWRLVNPFITSVDFGGQLDYSSDEMNEVTVEITFDWAELTQTQDKGRTQTAASKG